MIQKLTNDYKYRPHVILGSLAIAVVITSLATGALIALHGDIQNAFKHQHIAMLCLCSAEAVAFTSFCLLAVARLRMKHNYAEDADKLLTTPQALTGVRPLKSSRLPVRLIVYISQFAGDREMLILCLKFGIPITNKKYYEKFKEGFVQLCAYNDQHKRYFTPFYRGIMGVLSYQNLSLDKAVATLKQHKKLYDEDGHGFALAANLLLGPHEKTLLRGENIGILSGLGQVVIKCQDLYTIDLFLKNSSGLIDTTCVKRFANEATALLLLKTNRMTREIDEMMHHACLMGWSEFVDELFRLQPYKYKYNHNHYDYNHNHFFRTCWQSVFAGAFYRQQLLSSEPPYQEEIFRGIRNVYVGDGQKIHYLRRCEQIINGKHCEIAKTLLKQGKVILREVDCQEFNGLDLQSLPILQFVETFHLQDFIEFFAPMRERLLDPKKDLFVYFD